MVAGRLEEENVQQKFLHQFQVVHISADIHKSDVTSVAERPGAELFPKLGFYFGNEKNIHCF